MAVKKSLIRGMGGNVSFKIPTKFINELPKEPRFVIRDDIILNGIILDPELLSVKVPKGFDVMLVPKEQK